MLSIQYSKTPIGLIHRLSYGSLFLHRAYVHDTIEGKEEVGYVGIMHGDNGRRWPVLLLWRGREEMSFPDGYQLIQADDDIPGDEREATRKLLLLQAAWDGV